MPSSRLGMTGTSSSVPHHYPGTLSPAGRSQHNVGVTELAYTGPGYLIYNPKLYVMKKRESALARHLAAGGLVI